MNSPTRTVVVPIRITGFADAAQPGWVWCELEDASGKVFRFIEKIPVVTCEELWADSQYPRDGLVECDLIAIRDDPVRGRLATVSIAVPTTLDSYREDIQLEIRLPLGPPK